MTKIQKKERDEAITQLREWLKPGDTVYTILRSVSRSGMQREIGIVIKAKNGDHMLHPNYLVAKAVGYRLGKRDGIIIGGCGMDMGFAIVYDLGRTLFPDGFGDVSEGGIRPTSRDDAARLVADGKTSFRGRNGDPSGWDNDGGYALRREWL